MTENLQVELTGVSSKPGVYLMKGDAAQVIYVGKAANLKKRVSSYFQRQIHTDLKTGLLVKKIKTFETIVTGTEQEALILEANLIKKYRPRYNVILKDGKRFPSLCISIKEPYPNLTLTRKIKKNGSLYFGPFASPGAVYQTLKIINKTFKLRKCQNQKLKNRQRPCLNYQMDACLAPCCLPVDRDAYLKIVKEVILFLKGRTPALIKKIKREMSASADSQDYEQAAQLRDRMFALERILEKQVVVSSDLKDRDIIGLARSGDYAMITLLFVRGGKLLGKRNFEFSQILSADAEMIGSFMRQYYEKTPFIPSEILTPVLVEDAALSQARFQELKGKKVCIRFPQRGEKVKLVEMAQSNADNALKAMLDAIAADTDLLIRLRDRLGMTKIPWRIECFDNSNIAGTDPVAGMVVFEKGKPLKTAYRKYKIKSVEGPDDYASMAEVLQRRYGKGPKAKKSEPFPDLLMVDGGKGQLNIAVAIIRELGLGGAFNLIGIAKKDEKRGEIQDKIYKPGRRNPVNLGKEKDILFLLQRIRDESHRFAITFHRKRRKHTFKRSVLDDIPGIGPKRKKTLLKHFKSIQKIKKASIDQLSALPGMNRKAAQAVLAKLQER
ncbi:excinuclease ABC subunit UvrC [Desulfococcaceae bacterium HSG9]|nr:excinuclease ABC subunit UvrC [Desulfococcaceae bacterium HSG9]